MAQVFYVHYIVQLSNMATATETKPATLWLAWQNSLNNLEEKRSKSFL